MKNSRDCQKLLESTGSVIIIKYLVAAAKSKIPAVIHITTVLKFLLVLISITGS
jgi:hypothetical protein